MVRKFNDSDLDTLEGKNAVLTEDGIQIGNGEIITEGKVVDIARESQRFLEKNDVDGFEYYLRDDNIKAILTHNERRLLMWTEVSGGNCAPGKRPIIRLLNSFDNDKILGDRNYKESSVKSKEFTEEEEKAYYEAFLKENSDDDNDDFPKFNDISECYGD